MKRINLKPILTLTVLVLGFLLGQPVANANETIAKADKQSYKYDEQTLRVGLWLDREDGDVYSKGDKQSVGFQTNEDAYAVVYRIDTEGEVVVLWPRDRYDDGFVFGGHEYQAPISGSRQLRVTRSEGEGFVEAIVSRYPFDLRDLELDFHHGNRVDSYEFRVAGDPFLAINEVNFAITGLEDATDYVVTDFASYYVHRAVEHPRYLCGQCHLEDEPGFDPYASSCVMDIKIDYGWSNSWYRDYEYYPVYYTPVYVYYDPWTHRSWLNFWYRPWYGHVPHHNYDWGYWGDTYCWNDSPYYRWDSHGYQNEGHRRYKPLVPVNNSDGGRRKTYEYGRVAPVVAGRTPGTDVKDAMRRRQPINGTGTLNPNRDSIARTGGRTGGRTDKIENQARTPHQRPKIDEGTRIRTRPGLRIRGNGSNETTTRVRADGERLRSTGGNRSRSDSGSRTARGVDNPKGKERRVTDGRGSSGSNSGSRTIKPVEPRKRETRIWSGNRNSGSDRGVSQRKGSSGNSRSGDRSRSTVGNDAPRSSRTREAVKPRTSTPRNNNSSSRGSSSVKPKIRQNSSSGSSRGSSSNSRSSSSGSSSSSKSRGSSVKSNSSSSGSSSSSSSSSSGRSRSSGSSSSSSGSSSGKTRRR